MGDIYDIFTKKKVDQPRHKSFQERYRQCLQRSKAIGQCDCEFCIDKRRMSKRLADITRYLCKDYTEKTGKELYVADALEIVLTVAAQLKKELIK